MNGAGDNNFQFEDPALVLDKLTAIRNDPWEFLKIVRTNDPSDKQNPVKPFPVDLEYLKLYTRVWHRTSKILIPKSRRMKMSWVNICLYVWETMFYQGRHYAFVSKKEDDSNELIKRAHFVATNLDTTKFPKELIPECTYTFNKLQFPQINSIIQGFPSGAEQLRQYTFSGMLWDEFAFWPEAEKTYAASFPTLEGGGRFTGISSPGPGFFKRLVMDELDEAYSE